MVKNQSHNLISSKRHHNTPSYQVNQFPVSRFSAFVLTDTHTHGHHWKRYCAPLLCWHAW